MPAPRLNLPDPNDIRARMLKILNQPALTPASLNAALRLLAKYRSLLIQWEMVKRHGVIIQGGPFAGMAFVDSGSEGAHVAKLLGCYEQELHGCIEAVIATGYGAVVNIGCADGYYALGLARRLPEARVHAFDIDPVGRGICAELAARNGDAGRVTVGERFTPAMFAEFAGQKAFVMMDIEGAELELLGEAPRASLAGFDFIIECHDLPGTPVSAKLAGLLEQTHLTATIANAMRPVELPAFLREVGHLDQLLAVWEWRQSPTPWLVAASRERPATPFWRAVTDASAPDTSVAP